LIPSAAIKGCAKSAQLAIKKRKQRFDTFNMFSPGPLNQLRRDTMAA
jgi:hypothetical protein